MHTESALVDLWPQNDLELYFRISSTIFGIWGQKMFMGRFWALVTIPLVHEFLKLSIMNIHQKAKDCACRLYSVTTQKVAQILSRTRGKN